MKMNKWFLTGVFLAAVFVLIAGGKAYAIGTLGDSATTLYQNAAGTYYNTNSLSVYVTIQMGPWLTINKEQQRVRGGTGYVTSLVPALYGDTVSYHLYITNNASSDTAYNVVVTDTLTFTTLPTGDSAVYVVGTVGTGVSDSPTSTGASSGNTYSITAFEYTINGSTWNPAGGAATLASSGDAGRVRGLRWTINQVPNGTYTNKIDIYFSVRFQLAQ